MLCFSDIEADLINYKGQVLQASREPLPASDENASVCRASEENFRTFVQGKQGVLKYF